MRARMIVALRAAMSRTAIIAELAALATAATLAGTPARAQELAVYGGAGHSGLEDVRLAYGAGLSGSALYHDRIGLRVDLGGYLARRHFSSVDYCRPPNPQPGTPPTTCRPQRLVSESGLVLGSIDLLARTRLPYKGLRAQGGVGVSRFGVSNEIRFSRGDTVVSPRQSSSPWGWTAFVSLIGRPRWRLEISPELTYLVHQSADLNRCDATAAFAPLCGRLALQELRFALTWSPRWGKGIR